MCSLYCLLFNSINDNFFDLGGDSLSAIKLQIEAFNTGLKISYKDIFNHPTIKQLSEDVSKTKETISEEAYDYSKINALLNSNYPSAKLIVNKEKSKNVLLTGATGYLGSHILDNLLKHTKCNIYCLIRSKNNTDPQTRLLDILHFYFGSKYDKYIFKRIFPWYLNIMVSHITLQFIQVLITICTEYIIVTTPS